MLKVLFLETISIYCQDEKKTEHFWNQINQHYTQSYRHYHNLEHLKHIFSELEPVKSDVEDWNTVCLSVFYHDIIYELGNEDNEQKSAEFAEDRLKKLNYPDEKIAKCYNQIIATKTHEAVSNQDTNYMTDADLSIMGSARGEYIEYTQKIRKEYSIYPDEVYNRERKKVLEHFLNLPRIFKTAYFYDKYENQARKNLKRDLELL